MDIREFKNVYTEHAPSVIWDWCAKPSAEEIDEKLLGFKDCGISKVYIRPSNGLVLPYLSPDYFELVRTAARRCGKYGLKLYICDESTLLSGSGGGEITSVADYRMKSIIKLSRKDVEKNDEILSENGDSAIVLRDRSSSYNPDSAPVPDITDAFVTECFTDAVHGKYIKECKRFLGIEVAGFLTGISFPEDEIYASHSALKKLGYDSPKSIASMEEKQKQKYFDAFSESLSESFTGIVKEKCTEANLSLSVSAGGEKMLSRQLQYVKGDRVSLRVDTENPDFVEIKLAQSVCAQFGKAFDTHLLSPSFSPCSHRYNAAMLMTSFGAENIVYESVAYSLSDRRKYENHTVTLSQYAEKAISDRLARMCFVVSGTSDNAKLLVIYTPEEKELLEEVTKKLILLGIPFHMAEEIYFNKYSHNSGDYLTIGGCEYTAIIAPAKPDSLHNFKGNIYSAGEVVSPDFFFENDFLPIISEGKLLINRRCFGDDEYIFITSAGEDSSVTVIPAEKKLFALDSSNGEIYRITENEGECRFTVKAGKTAVIIHSSELSEDNAPPYTDDIEFTPCITESEIPFVLSAAEENILPVKRVDAYLGEKTFRDNNIDSLHRDFYALTDGEKVKVDYIFDADVKNIGEVSVYMENAENADSVVFNGVTLGILTKSPKDQRFSGSDITKHLKDGRNVLTLEYKKSNNYTPSFSSITPSHFYSYNITSFEPVYLCGDFDVRENALVRLEEYENDITASGMEYYYGPVTYSAKLPEKNLNEKVLSVHGNFDICRIKIGKRSFTYFSETPLIELFNLDAGAMVEVTLYNTPYNLMRTQKDAKPFGLRELELCSFKY